MPYSLLAVCGFLFLAVVVVFGQTVNHRFVDFDDDDYVYDNQHVKGGLTAAGIAWAFTAYHSSNWHPLTWLSHMLDCQFYHMRPGGHHLTNVLLHAATAVLLLLALQRMTGALWPSAWVAAVFAIHPLRVESVAWVAERKDVLSGLFFMLTLWFYAGYIERPASWSRYILVVASFVLGLTAKPMLVTLPFVLLLLDCWPLGRLASKLGVDGGRWTVDSGQRTTVGDRSGSFLPTNHRPFSTTFVRLVVEKVPLFVLAAVSCAVTLVAQREAMQQLSFAGRAGNTAVAYVAYLGKMLYPAGLAVLYPLPDGPPLAWEVVAAVSLLLAISTAVLAVRRKCPYLLFGWLWYLGTLVPVIGLVQVGSQAMADRYTYLTQIGLYMAFAWGAARVASSWPSHRWLFAAVPALVLAGLMVCAWQQTRYWRDSQSLWTHTLACTSQNHTAHYNLGLALADCGQIDEAIDQYQKALEIKPDYVEAHTNLGNAFAGRGEVKAAIGEYLKALKIKPDCVPAYTSLGNALADSGEVDAAMAQYHKALDIEPDCADAHNSLGLALAGLGQVDEAIACFRRALEIKPDYLRAHYNLGLALAGQGEVAGAIGHYRKALEIKPDYVDANNNLGLALAGRGEIDEAITCFRRALEIKPDYAEVHYNLGLALACRGRVDEVIAHYHKALYLAKQQNKPALAESIRAKIRLFQPVGPAGNSP